MPEDAYEVVLYCDNVNGIVDAICSYEKTVGTKFSQSMLNSMR